MGKFRPILFSTPMVQAIDGNYKTQTRRTKGLERINNSSDEYRFDGRAVSDEGWICYWFERLEKNEPTEEYVFIEPVVSIGDVFWARETFNLHSDLEECGPEYWYKADECSYPGIKWKPSLFMPKEACRFFLKITDIRIERLNDISSSDAQQEGIKENGEPFVERFQTLWKSINGMDSWDKNPFVWVYSFEIIEKPKDFIV